MATTRYTREFWEANCGLSGEQLGRLLDTDGGSARRLIRKAQKDPTTADLWPQAKPAPKLRKGIAYFDGHHPKHDKRLWSNILKFTADFDPDIFVFGGDNMDMEVVSHWVEHKRGIVEGQRLKADYIRFNRDMLDPLDAILRDDVERVFHLGNHEDWLYQYLDVHPEMCGLIEFEEYLHLDKWTVLPYGVTAKFGHLYSMHGTYTNIHNAMKTAQVYGRSVMYGHGHTLQTHTLVTPLDSMPYAATQIPCGCTMNPRYAKNRPNSWVNGFGVFYVQPDGRFNLYPVVAIDGAFVAPDGTLYE